MEMKNADTGITASENSVSLVDKPNKTIISAISCKGSLKMTCSVEVTENCTTCTSDAILDITSPFRLLVKKPKCRSITLSKTAFRKFNKVWIRRFSITRCERYRKRLLIKTEVMMTIHTYFNASYGPRS